MPIAQPFVLFSGNDQTVTWGPLILGSTRFSASPTYIDDATGTLTITDQNGNPVTGANGIPFTYVPGSTGLYVATILGSQFNPLSSPTSTPMTGCHTTISLSSVSAAATNEWVVPTIIRNRNSS